MNEHQDYKIFEEDGIRPIESGAIEIADSFEEDGIRPIGESPDFLVRNNPSQENDIPVSYDNLNANQVTEIEQEKPTDNSNLEVVDTFEEDGTRPIMANDYKVVDTLNVDGERPITSK